MEDGKNGLRPADLKEYVDIHGRNIRVEVSPSGEYLIPLAELKQTGFTVFVKSQYSKLLVDESDFTDEFNNHMLAAATTWCLSNKHSFSGHEIVQSIQNAKMILLAEHSKKAKTADVPKSDFLKDRSVAEDQDADIKITKTVSASPKPAAIAPSQTPHHTASPPVRPLTCGNLQLHNNEQKMTPVNYSNGNKTPPTKEASDGHSFEGNKGNFQGRKSFEQPQHRQQQSNAGNFQGGRRSLEQPPHQQQQQQQQQQSILGNPPGRRSFEQQNNQNYQRRSVDNNRNGESNGQFGQFNANNNTGQYGQRRSGGGGGGDYNQPRQRINSSDMESSPAMRQPHQRSDNQNGPNTPRMPPKGAYNKSFINRGGDFIRKVEMEIGEHEVIVTHVEVPQREYSTIWVQKASQLSVLVNIVRTIGDNERTQSAVEPLLHKVYMAKHEGDWYRCRVCGLNPTKVFFLDYGNRAIVDEVKPLSEELAKTPQQVIRVNLVDDDGPPPKVDDEITLIVENVHPTTKTHTARVKRDDHTDNAPVSKMSEMSLSSSSPQARNQQQQASAPKPHEQRSPPQVVPPKKPTAFFGVPQPVVQLRSEMMVKLVAEQLGCFYLFSKECAEEQKTIASEIYKTELKPVGSVQPDQLVLCRNPISGDVCRAVVLQDCGATVKVKLLDYPKTFDVPLEAVMAISESLSKRPTTLLKSPQIVNYTKPYGDMAKAYLQKCIDHKVKLTTLITPSGKFDMTVMETGEIFSRVMQDLDFPPTPPPSVKSNESNRIMLRNLEKVTLQCGPEQPLLCTTFVSVDEITVIPQTVELVELIERVLRSELEDKTPYVPIVNEVCMGFFEENWYRCAIRAVSGDSFSVFFIDFGNEIMLKSDLIRKLTSDMAAIPILGISARLTGCPRNPAAEKNLRSKILDEITCMNVISFTDGKYNLVVPQNCWEDDA